MAPFNYSMEAELFSGFARAFRRQPVGYRRFASAAEAIRFAMEELSVESLAGAALGGSELRNNVADLARKRPSAWVGRREEKRACARIVTEPPSASRAAKVEDPGAGARSRT